MDLIIQKLMISPQSLDFPIRLYFLISLNFNIIIQSLYFQTDQS